MPINTIKRVSKVNQKIVIITYLFNTRPFNALISFLISSCWGLWSVPFPETPSPGLCMRMLVEKSCQVWVVM